MLPEEVFKRRHYNTPESFFLITANYVTVALAIEFWAMCPKVDWFFWVVIGLLVVYNVYKVHREREMYDKVRIISYAISVVGLFLLFFILRAGNLHC
jgi:uncharacterized SAM-binding protein YcdF (DUF218 family)